MLNVSIVQTIFFNAMEIIIELHFLTEHKFSERLYSRKCKLVQESRHMREILRLINYNKTGESFFK